MKISVIIPNYNSGKYLKAAVQSVLINSSYVDKIEVLIVDDGSTDDSLKRVNKLPVRILSTGGRRGACIARNIGIKNASFDWIAFNDSDDFWSPLKLKVVTDAIRGRGEEEVDFLFHPYVRLNTEKTKIVGNIDNRDRALTPDSGSSEYLQKVLKKNFVGTPCIIAKKKILECIGLFDERLTRFQDWDLSIRLFDRGKGLYISEILSFCTDNPNSISKNFISGIKSRRYLLSKYNKLYGEYPLSKIFFLKDMWIRILFLRLTKFIK